MCPIYSAEQAMRLIKPALNSGFFSMKQLGASLLPPGWDASPSQDTQRKVTGNITTPPWTGC